MTVVAGGIYDTQVQIFDVIGTEEWRRGGNDLPFWLSFAPTVQFGNTFFTVGRRGREFDGQLDTIVQFNPDDETWTVREERLVTPRDSHLAVIVDGRKYNCTL